MAVAFEERSRALAASCPHARHAAGRRTSVTPMRRLLVLACAIVFVDTTFYAAITPLLPRFEDELGLSKSGAGVLAAAYPAGTFVGALPGGYLAARVGVRATVLLGLGLLTVSSVAFAFAGSVAMLDGARFVQGIGGAASWAGALAWIAGAAPRDRRGEMIGTAMAAAIAGALAGPALGALADAVGIAPTFCGVAAVGVALSAWALRTPPAAPEGTSPPRELLAALRDRRVAAGMWLIAVPGLVFGTIGVLAPLRLDDFGLGATAIAATWLGAALLESLISPLVGRVSDRRGRLFPSLIGLGAGSVLMLLFPWPDGAWPLVGLILLAAPLIGTLWTPSMALVSDGAQALGIAQGFAFALSNLGWSIGQTAGSAASSRLADATSDTVPYLLLSLACGATFAMLARARRRPAPWRRTAAARRGP
jgi:predicted MFS family arabinose efflux permease